MVNLDDVVEVVIPFIVNLDDVIEVAILFMIHQIECMFRIKQKI